MPKLVATSSSLILLWGGWFYGLTAIDHLPHQCGLDAAKNLNLHNLYKIYFSKSQVFF